jgi:hypothetical protein
MEAKDAPNGSPSPHHHPPSFDEHQKSAILRELDNVLNSHTFRTSERCKQFLSYVVTHALEGHHERLKERTIGVEVFHRQPSYATGDDPVVRVKATEVRRRLGQHYLEEANSPEVRIELPVGSYVPEFHWGPAETPPHKEELLPSKKRARAGMVIVVLAVVALTAVLAVVISGRRGTQPASMLGQFWAPLFTTSQPVLICLASPVVYRPSLDLYRRYSQTHPTEFQTEVERFSNVLRLDPNETLRWKDMIPYTEFYVAKGDALAAARLSALFVQINKPSQVRIGTNYSFEDLRNSPAVLIGAFNNRWTLQMTSSLLFVFVEDNGNGRIQEQKPSGRVWSPQIDARGERIVDYAVVSRLFDSKTGQLLIIAAGIGPWGTQAAGEFLSHEEYLAEGLRTAPADWQTKNLQLVLETNVIDLIAGPPRVVATHVW